MSAYYNEIDPYAAQWLRNLIDAGHIARGVVDTRSIEDVHPRDLAGFTQCHFFAGIGVWSYALRLAGWPDDRPVWTGSCPCQPFSSAGKGAGFDDERHLWHDWHHLIRQHRPADIIGEQVASKDADPWVDLVHDDLEAMGYAFGAVAFPAAGVGTPNLRERTYWMAYPDPNGCESGGKGRAPVGYRAPIEPNRGLGRVGHADQQRVRRHRRALPGAQSEALLRAVSDAAESAGATRELGDAQRQGLAQRLGIAGVPGREGGADQGQAAERTGVHVGERPGPTNGFWRDADWLLCRDGRWRPVEPGAFPLADGPPARVGRLRAYGNAINAQAAAEFIRCVM